MTKKIESVFINEILDNVSTKATDATPLHRARAIKDTVETLKETVKINREEREHLWITVKNLGYIRFDNNGYILGLSDKGMEYLKNSQESKGNE